MDPIPLSESTISQSIVWTDPRDGNARADLAETRPPRRGERSGIAGSTEPRSIGTGNLSPPPKVKTPAFPSSGSAIPLKDQH